MAVLETLFYNFVSINTVYAEKTEYQQFRGLLGTDKRCQGHHGDTMRKMEGAYSWNPY